MRRIYLRGNYWMQLFVLLAMTLSDPTIAARIKRSASLVQKNISINGTQRLNRISNSSSMAALTSTDYREFKSESQLAQPPVIRFILICSVAIIVSGIGCWCLYIWKKKLEFFGDRQQTHLSTLEDKHDECETNVTGTRMQSALPEEGNQSFANLSDKQIIALCRRASMLHFEMILFPTQLVVTRIRPELATFYAKERKAWVTVLALFLMGLAVVALPWVYTHTIMSNPCTAVDVKLGTKDDMKKMRFEKDGCAVETMLMQHPFSFGGILMSVSLVCTIVLDATSSLMYWIYYRSGRPQWLLNLKRLLWRPILMFWYYWIHPKISRLMYSNDYFVIPGLYSPPSLVISQVYLVLLFELIIIKGLEGTPIVGLLIAYAMGELLLMIGNVLVDAPSKVKVVTQGEMKEWVPEGWREGSDNIFDRLHDVTQERQRQLFISMEELLTLQSLEKCDPLESTSMVRREGEDSLDGVGVIEKVYVVDAQLLVDIVSERIENVTGRRTKRVIT